MNTLASSGPPSELIVGLAESATVVVTNYNYGRYLGATIDSALSQTVECQIVVVDDGSRDDSLEVLGRYQRSHPGRIQVVAKANGGQASAFNAGWERAERPVVFFLDGDDTLVPDAVEKVLTAFNADPDAVKCQFRMAWIDDDGAPVAGGFPEPGRALPAGDLRDQLGRNPDDISWQPTSGNAFRASVLDALLPMPEEPYRISADHYLSNVSALYGRVLGLELPLAHYRTHGANNDHRSGFDLDRARDILVRTEHTHRLLIDHGRALGVAMPADPSGFRSLTTAGLRLVSSRYPEHPFPADRRRALIEAAAASGWGREDFSVARRIAAVGWALLTGLAPSALVGSLAARALTR